MSRSTDNGKTDIPAEVSLGMSMAAHMSWAPLDPAARSARTAKARAAFQQQFLEQTKSPEYPDGDPVRAESLRKAFYAKLALKSLQTRRRNREARRGGAAA